MARSVRGVLSSLVMKYVVVVVMVLCVACEPTGGRLKRWPHHRQQGDERFATLEKKTEDLERRIGELEGLIARLKTKAKAAPEPPAVDGGPAPTPPAPGPPGPREPVFAPSPPPAPPRP